MGGVLGIGEDSDIRRAREQRATAEKASLAAAAQREAVRKAERSANKGKETAKIQLGADEEEEFAPKQNKLPAKSLGIKVSKTGVQI